MRVKVRLGPGLAMSDGRRRIELELGDEATVRALLAHLGEQEPGLEPGLAAALAFVRGVHAGADAPLADGDEVAVIVPVSGG